MNRRSVAPLAVIATALLLTGCTEEDSSTSETSSASTTTSTSATSSAPATSSTEPGAPNLTAGESAPEPEDVADTGNEPTATCATDYMLYQPGTTFYSDGTSGYTAECQAQMESLMAQSGQFPDYSYNNLPDPDYPDYIIGRDPSGAAIKAPEVQADANAGQQWWTDCMAVNDAATCRATDPWQQ